MEKEFSGIFLKKFLVNCTISCRKVIILSIVFTCILLLNEKLLAREEQYTFPSNFDYSEYASPLTLYINDIATLPGNIVFLGGYYHDGKTIVHPALFISKDEAQTWQEISLLFPRSNINHFQTINTSYVWAIITWRVEGVSNFTHLLYSTNAGESWELSDLGELSLYMQDRVSFQFFDELHGLLSVGSTFNQVTATYYTTNGGQHWARLWKSQRNPEIETSFVYPGDPQSVPPHAPLWTKSEHEYYKLTGVMQIRNDYKTQRILVEISEAFDEPAWTERSSIPRCFTIFQNRLIPCYEPGKQIPNHP